ncbi:hypothetical protein G7017_00295 [Pseudomonas fulva]|uniref:hypothetical protein n=1 Tax=Pseudomonas fulva TaxID=47880 RepID=UPI0015E3A6B4|nr:hypothetical protein [Pseudomonas fulva]MBA1219334.1 hypothetical protein [Pseudomonas fulva]
MINTTDELIILCPESQVSKAVAKAAESTVKILLKTYRPQDANTDGSHIHISSSNNVRNLSFVKFFPLIYKDKSSDWLKNTYKIINEHSAEKFAKSIDTLKLEIGITDPISYALAGSLYTGFRIFFFNLWVQKKALLTLSYSLPRSKKTGDYLRSLYPETLKIVRQPFISERITDVDIEKNINRESLTHFGNVSWRVFLSSTWYKVEDINDEDIKTIFLEIRRRIQTQKKQGDREALNTTRSYAIGPAMLLAPLQITIPDKCKFDLAKTANIWTKAGLPADYLASELNNSALSTSYPAQVAAWASLQQRYYHNRKNVKKLKSHKKTSLQLGLFNKYLFDVLPAAGITPPMPSEFDRRFIDNPNYPNLCDSLDKNWHWYALISFFDFLEELSTLRSEPLVIGFSSPILSFDIPQAAARAQTNKATFRANDFLLLYTLTKCIFDFTWHLIEQIGEGRTPSDWDGVLGRANNRKTGGILRTKDFGYTPIMRYTTLEGRTIQYPLEFIPISLIPVSYAKIKSTGTVENFPRIHPLAQTIVALETGLRHIHIRWLDKRSWVHSRPDSENGVFELLVNTDKVTDPWVRVSAPEVYEALSKVVLAQNYVDQPHFEETLAYDDHEQSRFGKICPIFMNYEIAKNYSAAPYSRFFNNLMYFTCQVKTSLGIYVSETMPTQLEGLSFNKISDFATAYDYREEFKSAHTPHSTRASVVSQYSPFLPPMFIGKYVTGHTNEQTVMHYMVLDPTYREVMRKANLKGESFNDLNFHAMHNHTESAESAISHVLRGGSIKNFISDFGAISYSSDQVGKEEPISGLSIIATDRANNVSLSTNICVTGGECPTSIITTIGPKRCGQCPYSVKTVDHLPRILAKSRSLARECDHLHKQLIDGAKKNASDHTLETIERKLMAETDELSAWMHTANTLIQNLDKLKNRVLVNQPDILKAEVASIRSDCTPALQLLIESNEAVSYAELNNAELKVDILKWRAQLLKSESGFQRIFDMLPESDPIDELRGFISHLAINTGVSQKEICEKLSNPNFPSDKFYISMD